MSDDDISDDSIGDDDIADSISDDNISDDSISDDSISDDNISHDNISDDHRMAASALPGLLPRLAARLQQHPALGRQQLQQPPPHSLLHPHLPRPGPGPVPAARIQGRRGWRGGTRASDRPRPARRP